jgi:type VI secretion system protein ImpG
LFSRYFQEELAYLRDVGREFSRAHPQLAPMLADSGADPSVERLLEGVSFLTARIREKLDDEIPEAIHAIAHLLFPQMLRPLPAACIVELTPQMAALREPTVVKRGSEFASVPVDGTPCRFRSTADCLIVPWEIEDVRCESVPGGRQQLRIQVRVASAAAAAGLAHHAARFHISAERRAALDVLRHLHQNIEDVLVLEPGAPGTKPTEVSVGKGCFKLAGFEENEALLVDDRRVFPGYRLLQEYYLLPEKFAFFDLAGLGRAMRGGDRVERYEIAIRCKGTFPDAGNIDRDWLRLHCVPVVNLFSATAEPLRMTPKRSRHRLRVSGYPPPTGEVYAISRVYYAPHGAGERKEVPSFHAFEHAGKRGAGAPIFYDLHLQPSTTTNGTDTFISFGTARDAGVVPDAEIVSCDLVATNGPLASLVRAGDIRMSLPSSPVAARFRNIGSTTSYVPAPIGRELAWRAVAHASMGLRSLTELEVLRALMEVYNFHSIIDRQSARANELRIAALREMRVRPAERLHRGAVVRGIGLDLLVDEDGFLGEGDIFLFSAILDKLFADYVSINSFSQVTVTTTTTNVKFAWPARSGSTTMV